MHCIANRFSGNLSAHKEVAIRNRILGRRIRALASFLLLAAPPAGATELTPQAVRGFDRYVRLTETRMQREIAPGGTFLWVDALPEPQRSEARLRLLHGEIVSARLQTADPSGYSLTPAALIHHWVGTIFIPGASLAGVLGVVQDYDRHAEYYAPDVVQSRKVEQNGGDSKVHYRLRKKKIVTVFLDTDYEVHLRFLDAARAYSNSHSTRIAQVENAGEAGERELAPGNDDGYLWRLNSYWRFFDSGSGVYVQCEAISLTRDIPTGLNWLVGPFIESVPKESLEFTLQSTREAVLRKNAHGSR